MSITEWHMYKAYCILIAEQKKIKKNIYRPDVQVTFEFYGYFRCLQTLYSKQNYIYWVQSYAVDFRAPRRGALKSTEHAE